MGWKELNYVSLDDIPGGENINSWNSMWELNQGHLANETELWNKRFSERVLSESLEDRKKLSHIGPDVKDFEFNFVKEQLEQKYSLFWWGPYTYV